MKYYLNPFFLSGPLCMTGASQRHPAVHCPKNMLMNLEEEEDKMKKKKKKNGIAEEEIISLMSLDYTILLIGV